MTADELRAKWEARRTDPLAARGLVPLGEIAAEVVADLTALAAAGGDEVLSLQAAAAESGFSADHLRHLVADGQITNAGRKGKPAIRRRDLPRKPKRRRAASTYDPNADALALTRPTAGRAG